MVGTSLFPHSMPSPLVHCCLGPLKDLKGRQKSKGSSLLYWYSCALALRSPYVAETQLLALYPVGHFNGSLGGSLLDTSFPKFSWDRHFLLLSGQRVAYPSVKLHYHPRQSSWDGSLLRWHNSGPSRRTLFSPQGTCPCTCHSGNAATSKVFSVFCSATCSSL